MAVDRMEQSHIQCDTHSLALAAADLATLCAVHDSQTVCPETGKPWRLCGLERQAERGVVSVVDPAAAKEMINVFPVEKDARRLGECASQFE